MGDRRGLFGQSEVPVLHTRAVAGEFFRCGRGTHSCPQDTLPRWFQDLGLVLGYWSGAKRTYHHTAPVNPLFGLHESLVMLAEEGLENAWIRHHNNHLRLRAGLEGMGLKFVVREDARLPQLNTVWVPEGVDEAAVRGRLLNEFGIEIGAGLGALAGRVWRIGLMGHSSRPANIVLFLAALESVLRS
jgi:alanine-glyoxylate transaminase/serine-glyoxylate transaminase/serine-pyruvate transaminase